MKIIDIITSSSGPSSTKVPGIVLWPGEAIAVRKHRSPWSSADRIDVVHEPSGTITIRVRGRMPFAQFYRIHPTTGEVTRV